MEQKTAGSGSTFVTGVPQSSAEKHEVTTFVDQNLGEQIDMGKQSNPIAEVDGTPDAQLGSFLSRPTLISQYSWTSAQTTGNIINNIDPWTLFINDTAIKNKISNFAYLRANLKVKVVVNASPFYYGLARTYYEPLATTGWVRYNTSASVVNQPLVTISQIPGAYIQPQASAGCELNLPFLWNKNWLNITSASEVSEMGRLKTAVFYPLASANGVGSPTVRVNVFAWLENVELMGPTVKLPLQATEWATGPISKPATALASIASALTNVPAIAPFARATEMVATTTARVAALFGFTNVPVIEDVRALIPRTNPALASAEIGTALEKLSLDPKQEITIDPSIHGLPNCDELAIPYIVQKESFLTYENWTMSNIQDDILWQIRVTPVHYVQDNQYNIAPLNQISYALTPMAYIAQMFQYWRGDIIVRAKIVCSKFHKGRLRVTYDPVFNIATTASTYNTSFTQIIDIGEENNVEFRIPYHQAKGWLPCSRFSNRNWDLSGGTIAPDQYSNGLLTVRVLNALTGPTSSGSVGVFLSVRGGENFEFAVPRDIENIDSGPSNQLAFSRLQSDDGVDIAPTTVIVGKPAKSQHQDRYAVNFGEQFISLRKLLHRHQFCETTYFDNGESTYTAGVLGVAYPLTTPNPGYANDAMDTYTKSNVSSAINFVSMTHISWIRNMFAGWRGSINNIFQVNGTGQTNEFDTLYCERLTQNRENSPLFPRDGAYTQVNIAGLPSNATARSVRKRFFLANRPRGLAGAAVTNVGFQPGVSVQFPYYNDYNFSINTLTDNTNGPKTNNGDFDSLYAVWATCPKSMGDTLSSYSWDRWVAAGPDFNCYYFYAAPLVYRYIVPMST